MYQHPTSIIHHHLRTMQTSEIASRVEKACENSKYVIKNLQSIGVSDNDILRLYGDIQNKYGFHGCIMCTAWWHAVRLTPMSKEAIERLLEVAENVNKYLGARSAHPRDGCVEDAMYKLLIAGLLAGVDNINYHIFAHRFNCKFSLRFLIIANAVFHKPERALVQKGKMRLAGRALINGHCRRLKMRAFLVAHQSAFIKDNDRHQVATVLLANIRF